MGILSGLFKAAMKKPKVDSKLSIRKKHPRSGKGKRSRNDPSVSDKGGKGFHEEKYKTTIKVRVKFKKEPYQKKATEMVEYIKGMNEGHALTRARSNWPGAAVIKIK